MYISQMNHVLIQVLFTFWIIYKEIQCLMLGTLGKIFSRQYMEKLSSISYFSQKTGFDISCKLSALEIIFIKC